MLSSPVDEYHPMTWLTWSDDVDNLPPMALTSSNKNIFRVSNLSIHISSMKRGYDSYQHIRMAAVVASLRLAAYQFNETYVRSKIPIDISV